MEIIYKKFELHIAELLGWFGIIDTPEGLIGYPQGVNPNKVFRSKIPEYIRNEEVNDSIAITYDVEINEYKDYYCGETYVSHFKDHKSQKLARQYLVVMEAIEKLEEDIMFDIKTITITKTNIIEFKRKNFHVVENYPIEVDY